MKNFKTALSIALSALVLGFSSAQAYEPHDDPSVMHADYFPHKSATVQVATGQIANGLVATSKTSTTKYGSITFGAERRVELDFQSMSGSPSIRLLRCSIAIST